MHTKYSLVALSNDALDRGIQTCAARRHATDAELLAFIAEYDSRRRYLALGYDSMLAFCVQALHLSEDSTYKRLQVVRVAQEFPAIFPALAEGRLHLTAVNLLATHLTAENVEELIAAARHKSNAEIRQLLAERYPKQQASRMSLLAATGQEQAMDSGNSSAVPAPRAEGSQTQLAPAQVKGEQTKLAPEQVKEVDCWARITPLSGDRYSVSLTINRATLELWRHNQALVSHQVPSGNLAEVLQRSLAESARQFEKRKFRASRKARRAWCRKPGGRYIPKHIRGAVWRRDDGQCTFVGQTGHRCGSRTRLEFDHIVPIARGGASTVDNLRLRCRVHNQFEAERVLGADFMRHKREQAHEAAEARAAIVQQAAEVSEASVAPEAPVAPVAPEAAAAREEPETPAPMAAKDSIAPSAGATPPTRNWIAEARTRATAAGLIAPRDPDIVSTLRQLGMRADQARALAKVCDTIPEAPFEERLRVALSFHGSTVAKPVRVTDCPALTG